MRAHARSGFQKNIKKQKLYGHKTDHNSGSRPPFDIKSSALDMIFQAWITGDSLISETFKIIKLFDVVKRV